MQGYSEAKKTDIKNFTFSQNMKIRYQTLMDYYECKINYLKDPDIPPHMIRLACWDVPIKVTDLQTKRNRKLFVRQCKKYYEKQLKEIMKKIKKL